MNHLDSQQDTNSDLAQTIPPRLVCRLFIVLISEKVESRKSIRKTKIKFWSSLKKIQNYIFIDSFWYIFLHYEVNFYLYIRIKLLFSITWENFDDAVTVGNAQTAGDSAVTVYKNHLEQNWTWWFHRKCIGNFACKLYNASVFWHLLLRIPDNKKSCLPLKG